MTNYRTILIRASKGRIIADSKGKSQRKTDEGRLLCAKSYASDAINKNWNKQRCLQLIDTWKYELAYLMPKTEYLDNLNEINTLLNATT